MLNGVKDRTKRFGASVLTAYVGILVALVLAVHTSTISVPFAAGLGVMGLLVTVTAEYVLTYSPLLRYRDRQLSTFLNDYLRLVENDVERIAPGNVDVRAYVMRPSSDGFRDDPTLNIAFYHNESDYDPEEFDVEFEIGQGWAGQAYQTGEQQFAISPDHVRDWGDGWNTTDRQDRITEHLNTIIGTPIRRAEDEQRMDEEQENAVAVLILDSEHRIDDFIHLDEGQELADIEFDKTEIAEQATEHARNVGILL